MLNDGTTQMPGPKSSGRTRTDADDAAMLVFEALKEIGLRTGELEATDFELVVERLLRVLDLRVASPERLDEERERIAQLDYIEAQHIAPLRQRLLELNRPRAEDDLPW
jgi:hypothetical protein